MSIVTTIPVLHFINSIWHDVTVERGCYADGSTALTLVCDDGARLTTATIFIQGETPAEGVVFVKDYSECSGLLDLLQAAGVLEPTGRVLAVGGYGATAREARLVEIAEPEVVEPVAVKVAEGDPRVVGGTYRDGYWGQAYRVDKMVRASGLTNAIFFDVTWLDDGEVGRHCTDWDTKKDEVLTTPWWIYIQAESGDLTEVGPYEDERTADLAMDRSATIQNICEEDCVDAWMDKGQFERPDVTETVVLTDVATGVTYDEALFESEGIDIGEPDTVETFGHEGCTWHAYDENGYSLDGGSAEMIVESNGADGNYPDKVARVCKVIKG